MRTAQGELFTQRPDSLPLVIHCDRKLPLALNPPKDDLLRVIPSGTNYIQGQGFAR
jgi:hypothetical protein